MGIEALDLVVMAIPGVVANGLLVWSHRAEAPHTRHLPTMIAAGVVGSIVGTMLLKSLDGRVLSGVLAVVIVGYIVLAVLKPGFTLPAPVMRVGAAPVGLVAGGLQGATGISGPLLTTWLHGFGLPPRAYVFAISSMFFVFSAVQTVTLAGVGLYTPTRLLESLLALVPILLALPLGVRAARKLSPLTFQRVVLVLLAASVVSLIHDTFTGAAS